MFLKSIRWRLQIWHAVTLLVVLSVFGAMLYYLQRRAMLQEVDAELLQAVGTISAEMRRPPRPPMRKPDSRDHSEDRRERPFDEPRIEVSAASTEFPNNHLDENADEPPDAEPSAGGFPPRHRGRGRRDLGEARIGRPFPGPPPWALQRDRLADRNEILNRFANEFEGSEFYMVAWEADGTVLKRTDSAPDVDFPNLQLAANATEKIPRHITRQRDMFREAIAASPTGVNVLVGRSIEADVSKLHRFMLLMGATGVGVLFVGLAGGWWLASRAIRPISAMTKAADAISADNLSQRIDLAQTEDELGNLANVLNSMFDRLEASFQQQVQFTADASHELRTPLTVMMTQAELALSKPRSAEEYRDALETCQQASQRMNALIEALLVLARMDAGQVAMKKDRIDLSNCVQDCLALVGPLAKDRNITIDAELPTTEVVGDADRLAQLTTNLLTNAIRYNRDGGRVVVSLETAEHWTTLTVSDTGVGIAADELSRIFDRFYRVDRSRSESGRGHGLGLSICQDIVSAHGGQISATSKEGVGTTFFVRLPR